MASVFAFTNAVFTVNWLNSSSDPGWTEDRDDGRLKVLRVRSGQQLHSGDEIVQLNGKPVKPTFSSYRTFENVKPDSPYTVQISRNSQLHELSLRTAEFASLFRIGILLAVIVVPAFFLLSGLAIFLFSLGQKKILLLAAALVLTIPDVTLFSLANAPLWAKLTMIVGRSLSNLAFPLYLNFLLTFPERSPLLKRFPFLNHGIYLYLPYFVIGFCGSLVISLLSIQSPDRAFLFCASLFGYLVRYGTILVYVPLILLTMVWSVQEGNPAVRRRIRIVVAGVFFGFFFTLLRTLFFILLPFMPFNWQARVPFALLDVLAVLEFGTLACMPAFFIYAIGRRQLIPLNIAIRRVVEYLITYFTFAFMAFVVTAVLSYVLINLLTGIEVPLVWSATIFVPLITLLTWAAFAALHNRLIKPRINRRSMHFSYDLREAMTDFFAQVRNLFNVARLRLPIVTVDRDTVDGIRLALKETLDTEEIASIVCRRIQETWIIEDAAILLEDRLSGDYMCSVHKSLGNVQMTRKEMAKLGLSKDARVVRELQATRNLLFDPGSWVAGLPESEFVDKKSYLTELQIIRKLRPALLIPILVEDQMIGILSLGYRAEAWAYSIQDRQTLIEIARETGEAIALARLKMIAGSIDLSLVLENVISATAVPAQKGSIYLWNEEEQALIFNAHHGYSDDHLKTIRLKRGEGFAGRAFKLKEAFVVDDAQADRRGVNAGPHQVKEIQSSVFVPLIALGRAIGVLCLDNLEKKAAFKKQHLDKLIRVASVASIVVQNAIMIDEQRNLVVRINSGQLSINDIFAQVFNSIRRVTDVRASHLVLLLDPYMPDLCVTQEALLCLAQGFGGKEKYKLKIRSQPDGLGYRALRENKAIIGDSLEDWQSSGEELDSNGTKACICLPLDIGKYVGGLLYLHYCSEHEFTYPEIITLRFFAEQTAVAISNARQRDELRYTNKIVWMSLMMSNIRHEIRQSSEAIRTNLDILNNRLLGQKEAKYLADMTRSLDEITELQQQSLPSPSDNVKDVLEFNKFLNAQVRRWCDPAYLTTNLKTDCYVEIDPKQFGLVLKNLIINAVRAMNVVEEKRLTVSSEIVGQRLMVRVSNTGIPIPAELQQILFTDVVYGTGNRQRTGVGLFIGRRIVRFHGGDLQLVKSDAEETIFSFWLPMVDARSQRVAKEKIENGTIQSFSGRR